MVGSSTTLYRVLSERLSYCDCKFLPICALLLFVELWFVLSGGMGSTQHCKRAHGFVLMTSGGSTPTFRQTARIADTVFRRSFILHSETMFLGSKPGGGLPAVSCRLS